MVLLQSYLYLVASILLATEVYSSPQDSANSGDPVLALNPTSDTNDLTNPDQQSLIAFQSTSSTPSDQGSKPLKYIASNQADFLAGNLSPNNLRLLSDSVVPDINTLSGGSQDTAFRDDGTGGVTDVIPSFPAPLINFFPSGLPEFDPNGVIRWFTRLEQPICDQGKFAFCCQQGPARFQRSQKYSTSTEEQKAEKAQRMRKCQDWSKDNPACYFPENIACCDCRSERETAFYCYNPNWRDVFQGKPQREPVLLPNPDEMDPNPPEPDSSSQRKRDWSQPGNDGIGTITTADLYAANPPKTEPYKRPGGRSRLDSTCTDEYLENIGVYARRYRPPSVHTPENPYVKPPGKRPGKNKPSPPPPLPESPPLPER